MKKALPINVLIPHFVEFVILIYGSYYFKKKYKGENKRKYSFLLGLLFVVINYITLALNSILLGRYFAEPFIYYFGSGLLSIPSSIAYFYLTKKYIIKDFPVKLEIKSIINQIINFFRGKKNRLVIVGIITFVLIIAGFASWGFYELKIMQEEYITHYISDQNGIVLSIEEVALHKSPFTKSGKANTIFKVTYAKDGKNYIAWYRGINNLSNIHESVSTSYEEKWIINEN